MYLDLSSQSLLSFLIHQSWCLYSDRRKIKMTRRPLVNILVVEDDFFARLSMQIKDCCVPQQLTWKSYQPLPHPIQTRCFMPFSRDYNQRIQARNGQSNLLPKSSLCISPFILNAPFLFPLKTQKTVRFSDVFRGQRKGKLGTNGLN